MSLKCEPPSEPLHISSKTPTAGYLTGQFVSPVGQVVCPAGEQGCVPYRRMVGEGVGPEKGREAALREINR